MRVVSGDIYDQRFKVEFALQHANKEEKGKNYYLTPNKQVGGEFLLDLGCKDSFNTVEASTSDLYPILLCDIRNLTFYIFTIELKMV